MYCRSGFAAKKAQANYDAEEKAKAHDAFTRNSKELFSVHSEDDWITHCAPSFRGICAIVFTRSSQQTEEEDSQILVNTIKNFTESTASFFKYISIDGECQHEMAGRFDVQTNHLPNVVAFSPGKVGAY
jgi:hypothetical protein